MQQCCNLYLKKQKGEAETSPNLKYNLTYFYRLKISNQQLTAAFSFL